MEKKEDTIEDIKTKALDLIGRCVEGEDIRSEARKELKENLELVISKI